MNGFASRTSALIALLVVLVLTGCATHKINWAGRVGAYTFDQAVVELGPPDKQAKLSDGSLVAEWLTRRGYRQTFVSGGYHASPWHYGYGHPPTYVDTYSPDYFLRLNFSPEGQLQSWKKFAR